jgi:hypothetical protein
MDVYKRETKEVVGCFLLHQLSFADCLVGLDDALAGLMLRSPNENSLVLCELMLANNELVTREMERRSGSSGDPLPPLCLAPL